MSRSLKLARRLGRSRCGPFARCSTGRRVLVIIECAYQRGHAIACTCDAAKATSASATAVTVQRKIIRPPRQRFTRRVRRRTAPITFSIAFVVESWRSHHRGDGDFAHMGRQALHEAQHAPMGVVVFARRHSGHPHDVAAFGDSVGVGVD